MGPHILQLLKYLEADEENLSSLFSKAAFFFFIMLPKPFTWLLKISQVNTCSLIKFIPAVTESCQSYYKNTVGFAQQK